MDIINLSGRTLTKQQEDIILAVTRRSMIELDIPTQERIQAFYKDADKHPELADGYIGELVEIACSAGAIFAILDPEDTCLDHSYFLEALGDQDIVALYLP